jgi:PAS domain-containing protein
MMTDPRFYLPRPTQLDTGDDPQSATPLSRIAREHGIGAEAVDAMVETLPVAVLTVDRDGRVVYANAEARALRCDRLDRIKWAVTRALLTEDTVREDDIDLLAGDRPRRWLSVVVTPVRTPGAGITAAFVVVSDVTARRQMNGWAPVIESLVNL